MITSQSVLAIASLALLVSASAAAKAKSEVELKDYLFPPKVGIVIIGASTGESSEFSYEFKAGIYAVNLRNLRADSTAFCSRRYEYSLTKGKLVPKELGGLPDGTGECPSIAEYMGNLPSKVKVGSKLKLQGDFTVTRVSEHLDMDLKVGADRNAADKAAPRKVPMDCIVAEKKMRISPMMMVTETRWYCAGYGLARHVVTSTGHEPSLDEIVEFIGAEATAASH